MSDPLPHMTPGRREWLLKLLREGPQPRPRGVVGYQCMRLGWSDWWHLLDDGRRMSDWRRRDLYAPEIREGRPCPQVIPTAEWAEVITADGIEALRKDGAL